MKWEWNALTNENEPYLRGFWLFHSLLFHLHFIIYFDSFHVHCHVLCLQTTTPTNLHGLGTFPCCPTLTNTITLTCPCCLLSRLPTCCPTHITRSIRPPALGSPRIHFCFLPRTTDSDALPILVQSFKFLFQKFIECHCFFTHATSPMFYCQCYLTKKGLPPF